MSEVLYMGDVLVTPKDNYTGISHYSVYAGKSYDGTDWAIHNNVDTGVGWIPLNYLLQNGYERIERFAGNVNERIEVVEKAKSMIGKSYSLLKFNCEHFARLVQTKMNESKQINTGIKFCVLGIVAIILYILIKENN